MLARITRTMLGSFFNRGGYVLDFSNSSMANFTIESVGFDVQAKYGGSKGASLDEFFLHEDENTVLHLTRDLVDYIELVMPNKDEYIGSQSKQYEMIKTMIAPLKKDSVFDLSKIDFSSLSNDFYLTSLIGELMSNADSNPASVIGQTKDLLETVYKRILEHYGIHYQEKANMTKLLSQVNDVLGLTPNKQDRLNSLGLISAKMLGNLNQVANGMNELRNQFGRGHGRGHSQEGAVVVPRRYANLAVGSASVLINFLTETVQRVDQCKASEQIDQDFGN
ncbi:abortive infection family protein [Lacticaseibacillus paracasei]|uniref:abortive infection family protein n=1 Tax=Lacticaseibacillus paracasei TaxID=1597 RepID=UPI001891B02A|nr:abortive infection family protein [Lacticaseibacillus paracasei]QPB57485.1 hypothetical protein GFB64_10505 [Lacticaseibacillus paracasei]WPQ29804.1 abortive infection family protein [Lacticaseibacillus paracasei]